LGGEALAAQQEAAWPLPEGAIVLFDERFSMLDGKSHTLSLIKSS
jgi:hypothetical protein